MSQTLLDIFQKKTVLPAREHRRPSRVFEETLDEWKRTRGNDLDDKADGAYQYFIPDLERKMAATYKVFLQSEEARAAIRAGANPDDFLIDGKNAHPGRYFEMVATWFGCRLIPLLKKHAKEYGQHEFAEQIEKSVRSWLAKADAVWEALETLPEAAKTRESFATWVEPLRADAERICDDAYFWVEITA
jgi:hypothetical protein